MKTPREENKRPEKSKIDGVKSVFLGSKEDAPKDAFWYEAKIRNVLEDLQWLISGILLGNIDHELEQIDTTYLVKLKEEIARFMRNLGVLGIRSIRQTKQTEGLIMFIIGAQKLDRAITKQLEKRNGNN